MPFLPLIAQDAIARGDDYQRRADAAKERGELAEHDELAELATAEYAGDVPVEQHAQQQRRGVRLAPSGPVARLDRR